jgi:hypothetical protein
MLMRRTNKSISSAGDDDVASSASPGLRKRENNLKTDQVMVETDTMIKINKKKNKQIEREATIEYLKKSNPKIVYQAQKLQDLLNEAELLKEDTRRGI